MKIGIVWKNDYPWDVRIEKFALALQENGFDVHILAGNSRKRKCFAEYSGIKVHRLPYVENSKINRLISLPFYFNPFWLRMTQQIVKQEKLDVLLVRDVPLSPVGLWIKKKYKIPLILDIAENYPAMYKMRFEQGGLRATRNFILKNHLVMAWVERLAINKSDHVFVVVKESADRLIKKGLDQSKITIVSNTPKLDEMNQNVNGKFDVQNTNKNFVIGYIGYMQKGRGLETILSAAQLIKAELLPVRFILVGSGDYLPVLKKMIKSYDVAGLVEYTGWVEHSQLSEIMNRCDAGIIPHVKNDHTDTTVPNKLFDFMAAGKVVIVTDARPLARIVTQENCGVVFESGNAVDLVKAIRILVTNRSESLWKGDRGRKAVENKYNWEKDSIELCNVIKKINIKR